jgi:hypothetical protein
MDIIIMSRRGKMKVLMNYNIYIYIYNIILYDKSDTSFYGIKKRIREQWIGMSNSSGEIEGAMDQGASFE